VYTLAITVAAADCIAQTSQLSSCHHFGMLPLAPHHPFFLAHTAPRVRQATPRMVTACLMHGDLEKDTAGVKPLTLLHECLGLKRKVVGTFNKTFQLLVPFEKIVDSLEENRLCLTQVTLDS